LQELIASSNSITEIQDGLFDGLNSLRNIDLGNNRISSIGLRVFSNLNDLVNLRRIGLAQNRLPSLEPWPYIRGLIGPPTVEVWLGITVYLSSQTISDGNSTVPNEAMLNWISFRTTSNTSDIFVGWNITSLAEFVCLMHYFSHKERHLDIDISWSHDYHCDCRDIELYKYQFQFFTRLLCSEPLSLASEHVMSVPLKSDGV